MDKPFSENNLALKDLLLEQNEAIKIVCANDKSHTKKLTDGI